MESNYNNREFEQLVKKNADQYRMIPSEKVWRGINNALHSRRRWYGLGLSLLLLLTAGSVTWLMVNNPLSERQGTPAPHALQNKKPRANQDAITATVAPAGNNMVSYNRFSSAKNTHSSSSSNLNTSASLQVVDPVISLVNFETERSATNIKADPSGAITFNEQSPVNTTQGLPVVSPATDTKQQPLAVNLLANNLKSSRTQETVYSLTIESVVNAYRPSKKRKKLSWQLYFAPTISYRKLSLNRSFRGFTPFDPANYPFASLTDVNKAVTHKPDLGLELGFSTRYPITKNLRLRGGLQFNINRYDIKAFVYNGEQATINLSGGNGNNSVTAWTNYRNYNGYRTNWLKNFYFTVSAPIGAELKLFGNDKTNFGIAGTVQPTYILSDRAYLISTDYKNYAEIPWLIRHVNVNTSFETFVSYVSRKTRWQVGPQVRYQVLSSFQNKYPVKENLFDFGLKVGVTLNQ